MDTVTPRRRRDEQRPVRHVGAVPALGSPAPRIDLEVPAGWVRSDGPGGVLLVARPPDWPGPLVPSLTVARVVATGSPTLAAYGERMVASTLMSLGGHLVHLGSGHRPVDLLDLTLATEQWGCDLTVTVRHVVQPGGEAVVATGAAADRDWADLALTLLPAVRSLRVRWLPVGGPA